MKKILIISCLIFSTYATADVLLIDRIHNSSNISTPNKGMLKSQVRNQYGDPVSEKSAVGEPPISIWHYEKFSVYFENDHVIHAVIKKATDLEQGPKPVE